MFVAIKKIGIIVFFSFIISVVYAVSPQEQFKNANSNYQAKHYQFASNQYQQLIQHGLENGEGWFNLGNCYYKLGKYFDAKYAYHKASLFIPTDKSLKKNVAFVDKYFTDKIDIGNAFIDWDCTGTHYFSLNFISVLLGIVSVLSAILFGAICIIPYWRQRLMYYFISAIIVFSVILALYYVRMGEVLSPHHALIVKDAADIRSGPNLSNTVLFPLHKGARIDIGDKVNAAMSTRASWYFVKFSKSLSGWVLSGDIVLY